MPAGSLKGHEDPFPRPGPNGRCRFGQETFARVRGNGRDAPIPFVLRDGGQPGRSPPFRTLRLRKAHRKRATSAVTILVRLSLRDGDAVPHAIAWMKNDLGTFGDTIKDFRLSVVAVANLDSGGARPPVADGKHLPIVALSEEGPDRHG